MAKQSFQITRDDAVNLLSQLEYKEAKKASVEKLGKMLKALPDKLEDGDDDDLNKKGRRILDDVTEAVNDGLTIIVSEGDDEEDEDDTPKKSSKAAKKAPAKKGAKAEKESSKKSAKGKGEKRTVKRALKTDRGGKGEYSLKTQQGHEINRLLERGPLTVEEAVSKAKVDMTEKRAKAHLDYLVEKERATVTKKGKYSLV